MSTRGNLDFTCLHTVNGGSGVELKGSYSCVWEFSSLCCFYTNVCCRTEKYLLPIEICQHTLCKIKKIPDTAVLELNWALKLKHLHNIGVYHKMANWQKKKERISLLGKKCLWKQ